MTPNESKEFGNELLCSISGRMKLWLNVILNEPKLEVKSILSHLIISKTCFHKKK